ncbi:uncharacterized protein LOC144582767 [Callithrix jacchus]
MLGAQQHPSASSFSCLAEGGAGSGGVVFSYYEDMLETLTASHTPRFRNGKLLSDFHVWPLRRWMPQSSAPAWSPAALVRRGFYVGSRLHRGADGRTLRSILKEGSKEGETQELQAERNVPSVADCTRTANQTGKSK